MKHNRYEHDVKNHDAKASKKDFVKKNLGIPVSGEIPKKRKNKKKKHYPNKNARIAARVCICVLLLIVVATIICLVVK